MKDKISVTKFISRFAAGLVLTGCFFGCAAHTTKTSPQSTGGQLTVELKGKWPKHPPQAVYEKIIVAKTKKKDGQIKVSCTLPQIQAGKILYGIRSVSVKDAQERQVTSTRENPQVTFIASEEQLPGITLDATYIDARSFTEITRDPERQIDWSIRFLNFRLHDILKSGIQNK